MCTSSHSGRLFSLMPVLALAALATGCHTMPSYSGDPDQVLLQPRFTAMGSATEAVARTTQDLPPAQDRNGGLGAAQPGTARQMVYSARFDIAASNVEEAMGQFIRGVQAAGGYLESREDARVVCRVPAARFQEIVAGMPALGNIVSQTIRNDDVTRQYHDLRLHIETAECVAATGAGALGQGREDRRHPQAGRGTAQAHGHDRGPQGHARGPFGADRLFADRGLVPRGSRKRTWPGPTPAARSPGSTASARNKCRRASARSRAAARAASGGCCRAGCPRDRWTAF